MRGRLPESHRVQTRKTRNKEGGTLLMQKIQVKNPVVELDGDEMTKIIWQWIR